MRITSGTPNCAARHVADGGCGVHDLVERQQGEIDRHQLDDGPHPAADAPMPAPVKPDSDNGVSRMRSSRTCHQPLGDRVAAAIGADILAHQEDALVADHRVADRLFHRFPIGDLGGFAGQFGRDWRRRGFVGNDMAGQRLDRLPGSGLGKGHRFGYLRIDFGFDAGDVAS
jgi:hypothetical protein